MNLEKATIIPIPKKPNPKEPKDFRPISIICPVLKIFERIIYNSLLNHFTKHNIIPSCQHGFTKNRSVTTQLIETFEDITYAIDKGWWVDLIFFDFEKAFDSVPHDRLISKLKSVGIEGPLLEIIKSYLTGRSFQVQVKDQTSEECEAPAGVPQGSVLGPLLFIFFISDLPKFCHTPGVTAKLFADDLKIKRSSPRTTSLHFSDFRDPIKVFISKLSKYCEINGLKINAEKCQTLHLGLQNPSLPYFYNSTEIPCVEKNSIIRDLGIYYSDSLKWEPHVSESVTKGKRASFSILKSIKTHNPNILANLFKTYIRPILEFASPVFSPYLEKDIKKLESVQKVYLQCCYNRIFFKKVQTPSYDFLLKYFKIESLQKRRLKADYKIFHQYMLGILPFPEQNAFRCVNSKTRGDMFKIQTNPSKTKIRQNSFFTRTSVLYSKLPIETRQKDLSDFMKDIDSLFLTGNDL
ncbi:RNA-directed DNA polymerase [Arachidicoccus sp.]|uniref:RNA-directed DNA polymerase n=1 Tax=Arachidicoccus sp. TaxID=1872624 RepID=UPI003D1F5EBD